MLDSEQSRLANLVLNVLQSIAVLVLFWWTHRHGNGGPPST